MAGLFKNAIKSGVSTIQTVYASPSGQTSAIISAYVTNNGSVGVQFSAFIVDTSATVTSYIIKEATLPAGSSLAIIGEEKIILESLDTFRVQCDTGGQSVDVICSVIENVNA